MKKEIKLALTGIKLSVTAIAISLTISAIQTILDLYQNTLFKIIVLTYYIVAASLLTYFAFKIKIKK